MMFHHYQDGVTICNVVTGVDAYMQTPQLVCTVYRSFCHGDFVKTGVGCSRDMLASSSFIIMLPAVFQMVKVGGSISCVRSFVKAPEEALLEYVVHVVTSSRSSFLKSVQALRILVASSSIDISLWKTTCQLSRKSGEDQQSSLTVTRISSTSY